jgi:hypothetical protein
MARFGSRKENTGAETTESQGGVLKLTDEELIKKTWGQADPEQLFLKRLHEAAGSEEDLRKFLAVLHKIAGPLNQARGLDESGKLLRDKQIPHK